jgi:TRAP-type C4-dicarboxylate transport system permease large subunit
MVAPLLLPIIQGLGFDPVWFAVIMTVNLKEDVKKFFKDEKL